MLRRKKFWKRIFIYLFLVPTFLFFILVGIVYWKQEALTQELIKTLNKDFKGRIEIEGSHVSPFASFPYISIDLEKVKVFEDKSTTSEPILSIDDVYLGFDIWTLLTGDFEIKSIKLSHGFMHLIQHVNGELNLSNALSSTKEIEDPAEEFHMDLKSIQLKEIDIYKLNESTGIMVEAFIDKANSRFKTSNEHLLISLDSKFVLNVLDNGDTTFFRHKHFDINTELDYQKETQILTISPSEFELEHALFGLKGSIDFENNVFLDLALEGHKSNFDIFLAFAPEELAPVLQRYDNKGKIYFAATIKGESANGKIPHIDANFGCDEGFFQNKSSSKTVDGMSFKGHFSSGETGQLSDMEFSLEDINAHPEAGLFKGHLRVKNFESPEIDTKIISDFDLDFLSQFLNISDIKELKGKVALTMNFKDIIDLNNPERSIEKLNESYYTELLVTDLSFRLPNFHLPIKDIDIKATMDGHAANIQKFDLRIGNSDLHFKGSVSDLPAIIHHTNDQVNTILYISSKFFDINELTSNQVGKKPFDEQLENFSMKLAFKSSAKAFTESPNLPLGEFFIEDLFVKMKHYPHTLHDFHADVYVDENDFRIVDFTGEIDKSDFHFSGKLMNYDLWFLQDPKGDTKVEFKLNSNLLQLEDLFAYGGENHVPEDYRHEEFRQLKVHGFADLHFNKGLKSSDVYLDQLDAQMKVHPMKFEKFKGRIHYEDEHLVLEKLYGKIGKSTFTVDLNYYLGKDKAIRKRDNHFSIHANHLDFDELFNYNPPPTSKKTLPADHENVFNIYELPFSDMTYHLDIQHLNYHRYLLNNIHAQLRTTENHYMYFDTLSLYAAGGHIYGSGYMNGSNPKKIYFSPKLKLSKVDLDKLLFKFENFGQDHLISENLHGKLTAKITGKIHMHADMIPIIDDSEIHMDVEVINGKLENYGPILLMADYFKDKNITKVLFDTLRNHIDMINGKLTIPNMLINTTLGFIEISGTQDMDLNFEYYLRIPWKMVTDIGKQQLFGSKNDEEISSDKIDEIQYKDENKKVRYLNLKIAGNMENYKITLGKDKKKKK